MKKSLFIALTIAMTLNSCEKLDKEVFLRIGSEHEYLYSDIELYDTSTHIIYFKNEQEYLKDIDENTFTFLNNRNTIYQGSFMPPGSDYIPDGPFIMLPPMYGNYALRIENYIPGKQDIRKNPEMINILKQHNLLHSGLMISSSSIEINETNLIFRFTVMNQDQSDLMIIDLDKTGSNLFHYFTKLYVDDLSDHQVFSSNIQPQAPEPWNSFKIEWLTVLKSGDAKQFTINYTLNNPINPGEYIAYFRFPGMINQVAKDQLYQGNSRIWLGSINIKKKITVQ